MEAARHGHKLAVIQSEWLQGKNNEITRAVQAVVPYYQEMAAAQLAAFEESRENVESLMKGIASLDLFIGKDVVVNTIIKGNSAPSDIPLTFVQKKLLMDEELAVYLDLGDWFDFTKADLFDQALQKHPGLAALGTEEHFEQCAELMRRGQVYANASRKCCPGNLSPQLIGLEGCRVRVTTDDGEERCFWVAKTTGWMPGHLEVPRSNTAYGHPAQAHYKSVQTIR